MARIYVEVFGCSANVADAEMVSGLLMRAGHAIVGVPEEADACVVLTCTVKAPTERKVVKRLRRLSNEGVSLVVAGCMPKAQRELVVEAVPEASMLGPDDLFEVVDVVEEAMSGNRIEAVSKRAMDKTRIPRDRVNPVVHIAPISSGCLGSCSYCIVRRARGPLHSYPADSIIEDARRALEGGCREIWVTAEDTAAYCCEGTQLPQLLEELSGLPGRFFIRVGMMNPDRAGPILDELVDAYSSEKVFKFLHIPVQSGNDDVLRRMRRRYTVDDFRGIVAWFRDSFPGLSLSTDIICGFPGETDEQFMDSIRLVEEVGPDVLNISRFWPRPGTEAEGMNGQLHGRETKKRSRMLSVLWRRLSFEKNRGWMGWRGDVLIDEAGRGSSVVGRNFAYKPVVLREPVDLGEFVEVEITGTGRGYLLGKI